MRILLTTLPFLLVLSACGDNPEPASMTPQASAIAQPPAEAAPTVSDPPGQAAAGANAPALNIGKIKYASNCLGCHGRDGAGQGVFPKLAGKPAAELAARLRDYRAGKTVGPQSATMTPFAKALTDAEIDALAGYLAGL